MPELHFIAGAIGLGILTSVSPCPLATNIAAVAFLARRTAQGWRLAGAGLAYTCGRALAYGSLAALIAGGLLSRPAVSDILRNKLGGLIGPLLILTGLVVSGWLPLRLPGSTRFNTWGQRLAERGLVGEFLLGILFALSFCPASAALFFGPLLALVIESGAPVPLSVVYGIGTALPVLVVVALLAGGIGYASRLQGLHRLGARLQLATGVVMIAAGAWMTVAMMLR